MNILKVIHGYPYRYNAGSEVYSQTLCHELIKSHNVSVFTREEDSFASDFRLRVEQDQDDHRIRVYLVNNPRLKDRYIASGIDQRFSEVMSEVKPDVVHFGHLNHLSTSLVQVAANENIPIVFTLHDYWLMCPRGQFMQMFAENSLTLWAACVGQEDRKCALRCYSRYFTGALKEHETDVAYWADWVARRMRHVREMAGLVNMFIAPAKYLLERYRDDFGLPESKLTYLDYGFATDRMRDRSRHSGEPFTFGYIGTHIPAKGIQDLIRAFGEVKGDALLRVWGRHRGQDSEALKNIAKALPKDLAGRVEWLPEYKNQNIVHDVFDRCDAIVVPSIWVENSPLVIHEAQQARVPVITADAGGMGEYVHHEVNGLLYAHRSISALTEQMQRFVANPDFAKRLGNRGYLYTESGDIPDIQNHAAQIERIYSNIILQKKAASSKQLPGPWRITFDTNPDTCNLNCIMCEEHSPYSSLQARRKADERPQRIMPFEMIRRVVEEAVPYGLREIIPSTMGEPLLYDHFDDILELCKQHRLKLNLTTNGTFPRYGAIDWAQRIVPVTSDIKISWNGATKTTQERIMRGSSWEKALENVREFLLVRDEHAKISTHRCRVTFQLTFLDANIDELADMVHLAARLGIDRVKGHHVWTHFPEIEGQSMRRDQASIKRWNQALAKAQQVVAEPLLPNGKRIILDNFFELTSSAPADLAPGGLCPFLGQEAWVGAEGRFSPCCAPDAQRRELGGFGNLHESNFMEIWQSEKYQKLITTYQTQQLCRRCNMRKPLAGPVL